MYSANQARLPITESAAELAVLVEGMSPLVLALSAVHMSGNLDIIRGRIRPQPPAFNGDTGGSLAPEDAAELRARALAIVRAYRDAGHPEPFRPNDAELREMMSFLLGLDLPEPYVPMIREGMAFDAEDARAFRWNRPVGEHEKAHCPVVIVGAGMSGMLMGLRHPPGLRACRAWTGHLHHRDQPLRSVTVNDRMIRTTRPVHFTASISHGCLSHIRFGFRQHA